MFNLTALTNGSYFCSELLPLFFNKKAIVAYNYKWRQRCGGMEASELKRIKKLEEENARLKKMHAKLALELDTAKYVVEKKL